MARFQVVLLEGSALVQSCHSCVGLYPPWDQGPFSAMKYVSTDVHSSDQILRSKRVYFHGCFKFLWKYFPNVYILLISLLQPLLIYAVSDREQAEVYAGLHLFP